MLGKLSICNSGKLRALLRTAICALLATGVLASPIFGGNDLARPKKQRQITTPDRSAPPAARLDLRPKTARVRLSPLPNILYPYIMPDENGLALEADPDSHQLILQMRIEGHIGENEAASALAIGQMLYQAENVPLNRFKLAALLLLVNTHGGEAFEATRIYEMLKEFKARHNIPVYAFVGSWCMSGGVMISAACDEIYMAPGTLIGSIGVVQGPFFNYTEGMERLGIYSNTLVSVEGKDRGNSYRKWTENEFASHEFTIEQVYQHFIASVIQARPLLNETILRHQIGASPLTSHQAKEIGLVDAVDLSRSDVLKRIAAATRCGGQYRVVELMPKIELSEYQDNYYEASAKFGNKPHMSLDRPRSNVPLMYYP